MVEILTFGPDDKVTVGASSTQRYADGGLRLDLRGGGFYGLVISGARTEDQGKYVCTAREWVRQAGGTLDKILEKSEDMGKVTVKPTGEGVFGKLKLRACSRGVSPSDTPVIICMCVCLCVTERHTHQEASLVIPL